MSVCIVVWCGVAMTTIRHCDTENIVAADVESCRPERARDNELENAVDRACTKHYAVQCRSSDNMQRGEMYVKIQVSKEGVERDLTLSLQLARQL